MDNLLKDVIENRYNLDVFGGKYYYSFNVQFHHLFNNRKKLSYKNQKQDLKKFFNQKPLYDKELKLAINGKYQVQLSQNKYLRQLLKENYIKIVRNNAGFNKNQTYLVKA